MTTYLAYFDSLGFEFIYNVTAYDQQKLLDILGDTNKADKMKPQYAILRAMANPQRFPEIWAFESDVDQEVLEELARERPQHLANMIRERGQEIYRMPKQKSVIE